MNRKEQGKGRFSWEERKNGGKVIKTQTNKLKETIMLGLLLSKDSG